MSTWLEGITSFTVVVYIYKREKSFRCLLDIQIDGSRSQLKVWTVNLVDNVFKDPTIFNIIYPYF